MIDYDSLYFDRFADEGRVLDTIMIALNINILENFGDTKKGSGFEGFVN